MISEVPPLTEAVSVLTRADTARPQSPLVNINALTKAIRRGDELAFDEFYELYCDRLYYFILGLKRGNESSARDILQTVMVKLAPKLPVIDSEPELWAWLTRVARNATIDHYRRLARSPLDFCEEIDRELASMPEGEGDDTLFVWLEQAIRRLDSESQRLLTEFYFKGRTYEDLALASGKTAKAIESKLARIRAQLRSFFQSENSHEK